ncbi:MAG: hypothetical protein NTY35_15420 [Planctomycetota bacterium]|nr:hypothetical protein [Planctomycetota bacterium]
MATEKSDNTGERPLSMKERLLAQRRADAAAQESSAPAAPPVPAAKPAARPNTAPAAAPKPAAAPAPRTAAPAPSTRPAASSRASAPSARPAPAAKPAAPRRDAKTMSADVQREVEMLRKQQDKWLMYGWIVAGVMILGAGGFFLYSKKLQSDREEAKVTYETTMKDLQKEITSMPINSIDAAQKVIARAEETKVTVRLPNGKQDEGWKDTYVPEVTGKIASAVGKATSYIKTETTRNELINGLAALEAAVRDAANKKPEELAQLKRRLVEYEGAGSQIGTEFETRVARAKIDLNRAVARRLFDEARVVAGKGEARAALAAYAKAEDELRALMDEAYSKRNQDAITWVEPLYQQCIEESDKIVYAAFTPENIDKTPWTDILATPEIKWGNDGLKGFRTDNGQVQAIGSDPGSKREGVFSVGDLENWRDFVMEVEFTPVRGQTKLYWRLGKLAASAPDEFVVNPSGDDGFKPGQTYSIKASYLGSKRTWEFSPNLERETETVDGISWRRQRVGAFGAVLAEGAEFKITKLRIKVLRGGKSR